MNEDPDRLQRAIDASMIIALGKTIMFAKYWEYLKPRLKTKGATKVENVRIGLREQVNSLPDGFFFMPPELASSEASVRGYFQTRFDDETFRDRFSTELMNRARRANVDLRELLGISEQSN